MKSIRQLLDKGSNYDEQARKIVEPLKKETPLVAEILGGCAATKTEAAVSPGTITIFVHEGKARFSINVKSEQQTFIGDLADLCNPFACIEIALSMGEVSSKRYTERNAIKTAEENGVKIY